MDESSDKAAEGPIAGANREGGGGTVIAFVVLGMLLLPIGYVLSIGPIAWLAGHGYIAGDGPVGYLYLPLWIVCYYCPPFDSLIEWYVALWD